MSKKKTADFARTTDQQIKMVARCFHALSDPTRLRVLQALRGGELSVQELCERFTCSQPNISRHLAILANAGLVNKKKQGSFVLYSVADDRVFDLCNRTCVHVKAHVARYND